MDINNSHKPYLFYFYNKINYNSLHEDFKKTAEEVIIELEEVRES